MEGRRQEKKIIASAARDYKEDETATWLRVATSSLDLEQSLQ